MRRAGGSVAARAGNTGIGGAISIRPSCRSPAGSPITRCTSIRSRSTTASTGCPRPATFAKWREQAPPRFLYAVKASRFLTHMKKLKDPQDPLAPLLRQRAAPRPAPRAGPLSAAAALAAQPRTFRDFSRRRCRRGRSGTCVEFRDPSWYDDRVYALLRRYKVALCLHDMEGSATERDRVGPFVYVRFHHGTKKYGGRYSDDAAGRVGRLAGGTRRERARRVRVFQQRHRRACAARRGSTAPATTTADLQA